MVFLSCILVSLSAHAATKVQEVTGGDGQKAFLIEDHSLPVVTVRIEFTDSGAAYDPKGREGLAYFAMQMLNEGAGDMDSLAFNRALEDHAIRFSSDAGEDNTAVSLQSISEFRENAFDLLSLALNKPRFDAGAVERVRQALLSEIKRVQEDPTYIASLSWKELAFPSHPYRNPRIGTLESVSAVKHEDLEQFQSRMMACSKKNVAVVGDIGAEEVKKLLLQLFPSSKCTSSIAAVSNVNIAQGNGKPAMIKAPFPQTVVQAGLPAVKRNDPDYYALVVLNHIFGGDIFSSRLGEEIRNKRGFAYYADSEADELAHANYISVHFATRGEQAENALRVFLGEQDKMRDKGVTQSELDSAKRYLTGSFPLSIDNQGALTEYLIQMQRYHLGIDYLEKRNGYINAVTLPQVNALAGKLFTAKPLVVMVGIPQEEEQKK